MTSGAEPWQVVLDGVGQVVYQNLPEPATVRDNATRSSARTVRETAPVMAGALVSSNVSPQPVARAGAESRGIPRIACRAVDLTTLGLRVGRGERVVSLRRGRIRRLDLNLPATRVRVDRTVEEVGAGDYDGLLVPGGFINPDLLRQSAPARALVHEFVQSGKPVVTLCHGPWVLASAGVLQGRTVTSWAGIRDDVVNAGATWLDQEVVREGNLTTSRGPQDLAAFVPAMLESFAAGPLAAATSGSAPGSDPQRSSPPELVTAATRWSPRLSTIAAAGVALAARFVSGRARPRPRRALTWPAHGCGPALRAQPPHGVGWRRDRSGARP